MLIGAEGEVAADRGEIGLLESGPDCGQIVDLAGGLQSRSDQPGGVVPLAGVEGRCPAVGLLIGGDKLAVGRIVEVMRPLRAVFYAEGGTAHRTQNPLVKRKAGTVNRDGLVQTGLFVLFEKIDAHAARQEKEHRVRIRRPQRGDFRRIVGLIEGGVDFACDIAFVVPLEAGQMVLACRIVGGQEVDILMARFGHILADHLVEIVVLVGDAEIVGMAAVAGKLGRSGIGAQIEHLIPHYLGDHGHGHVGKDDAGHDFDPVFFDESFGDLLAFFRLAAVVFDQQFHRYAAQFAAFLVHGQLKAIADFLAEIPRFGGKGGDHSDLYGIGSETGAGRHNPQGTNSCDKFFHASFLSSRM